jgi:hypothetical protein
MLLYIRRTGKVAIDEMCVCGHPKSKHGSHTHRTPNALLRLPAVGSCCEGECDCARFQWAGWIYGPAPAAAESKQQKHVL